MPSISLGLKGSSKFKIKNFLQKKCFLTWTIGSEFIAGLPDSNHDGKSDVGDANCAGYGSISYSARQEFINCVALIKN